MPDKCGQGNEEKGGGRLHAASMIRFPRSVTSLARDRCETSCHHRKVVAVLVPRRLHEHLTIEYGAGFDCNRLRGRAAGERCMTAQGDAPCRVKMTADNPVNLDDFRAHRLQAVHFTLPVENKAAAPDFAEDFAIGLQRYIAGGMDASRDGPVDCQVSAMHAGA